MNRLTPPALLPPVLPDRARFRPGPLARCLLLAVLVAACGGGEPPTPDEPVPASAAFAISVPDHPIQDLAQVEDDSEDVANRFFGFSDKLERRDFSAAAEWLSEGFRGTSFSELAESSRDVEHLGATRTVFDPASARVVDGAAFLESLRARLEPWARVEQVLWKVKGAEFQTGRDRWGWIRFQVTLTGVQGAGWTELVGWGDARVTRQRGEWFLDGFRLTELKETHLARPIFTEVAAAAGVAHRGIRFGQPGNDSFAWNGAAGGDVDGDGDWDLFVPSRPRSFLYLRQADGSFRDEAAERGVDGAREGPGGGTGAVFFDFDNDGDQDLAVADTGWRESDNKLGGNRLRLYVNDGKGRFTERGEALGFDALCNGFTLTVLDFDADGWLDVFVSNYGRPKHAPNNSWTDATNGGANLLFKNIGGRRFEDVAAAAGVASTRWTYASASADFDEDGDPDLYVANDYGQNALYRNRGDGTFDEVGASFGVTDPGQGMGVSWGDMDGDARLDLYSVNMSSTAGNRILKRLQQDEGVNQLLKYAAGNTLFLARAGGDALRLEPQPSSAGGVGGSWAWGTALVDLDLDGRLDIFCANGFITGDLPNDT